jgi:hypothetical protein
MNKPDQDVDEETEEENLWVRPEEIQIGEIKTKLQNDVY